MSRLLPLALAALLAAACADEPGVPDSDHDGYPDSVDCDDHDPAEFQLTNVYRDVDRDGVGAGNTVVRCIGGTAPAGYSGVTGDCAPDDPAAWRTVEGPPVDSDGDGVTTPAPVTLCLGAATPAPYLAAANGNDCDDANPGLFRWVNLYRDQDGDGVGAGPRSIECLGAALPAGWVIVGGDPDDADPGVTFRDDEDELVLE